MGMNEGNTQVGTALEQELLQRKWPEPTVGIPEGDYLTSLYVKVGRVFTRALRLHQQVSEPIPAGESAVTALLRSNNQKIYGATSGKRSHLFFYDTEPSGDGVVDMGVLAGVKGVRGLAEPKPGMIIVAASEMEDPAASGPLFVHDTAEDLSDEFHSFFGGINQLAVPVDGECVVALVGDPVRHCAYGLSSVTGTLFRYDAETGSVTRLGPVSPDAVFSATLVLDADGNVFGARSFGTLFRYLPEKNQIEDLGIRIPSVAGRQFYNKLDSAVLQSSTGLIYGAGSADGTLFCFDPKTLDIRSLGKATAAPGVRALAAGADGRIYGISGTSDGMGHLFRYDPKRAELLDLGIMLAASEIWRRGFEFCSACTGKDGEIYFGETEWESHLFIYFPPIV